MSEDCGTGLSGSIRGKPKMVRKDVWLNWMAHRQAFLNAAHRIPLNPAP